MIKTIQEDIEKFEEAMLITLKLLGEHWAENNRGTVEDLISDCEWSLIKSQINLLQAQIDQMGKEQITQQDINTTAPKYREEMTKRQYGQNAYIKQKTLEYRELIKELTKQL